MVSSLRVNVYGLGYVGMVYALAAARKGHRVVGVERNRDRLKGLEGGQLPYLESDLQKLYASVQSSKNAIHLRSNEDAIPAAHLHWVCVGTPSENQGVLDRSQISQVCETLGRSLLDSSIEKPLVVFASTLEPGVFRSVIVPALAGVKGFKDIEYSVVYRPEFLREGRALEDIEKPALNVIGVLDPNRPPSDDVLRRIDVVFPSDRPCEIVPCEEVEAVKMGCNAYHALKISFANEMDRICTGLGIDGESVMRIIRSDDRLNSSGAYLRPGFAFGGPCLEKDLLALSIVAKHREIETPLLDGVLKANDKHIHHFAHQILSLGLRRIGFYGASFKPESVDQRGSSVLKLVKLLEGHQELHIDVFKVGSDWTRWYRSVKLVVEGSSRLSTSQKEDLRRDGIPFLSLGFFGKEKLL